MVTEKSLKITLKEVTLSGILQIPKDAIGIVLFAHGAGSSRFSPRNQLVAQNLREKKIATLLFDLLTKEEEIKDLETAQLRFNVSLLAERLEQTTDWIREHNSTQTLPIGYFGASTGAAAALIAASLKGPLVKAVVSRGGRPDLAGRALKGVSSPTLLIVGGEDPIVLQLNENALSDLKCEKKLIVVPHATHLFEEEGALENVSELAGEWFLKYLRDC